MALDSFQLEAFLAVAKYQNFTSGAASLNITQSALSQRIQKLEEELGVSLFVRQRIGARLTPTGDDLLRYCKTKNQLEDEFLSQLRSIDSNELSGSVSIGGFSSVIRSAIIPAIADLMAANPKLLLNIQTSELSELPAMLRRGEIDYMVLSQDITSDELERIDLGTEKNVLCKKRGAEPSNTFLDHDAEDTTTFSYFRKAKSPKQKLNRRFLDDVYGLVEGVKLGLGMAVLPIHLVRDEKSIEVISPKIVLEYPVALYFFKQPYYSRLHREVLQALTKNTGKFLDR